MLKTHRDPQVAKALSHVIKENCIQHLLTIIFLFPTLLTKIGISTNKYRNEIVVMAGEMLCEETMNEETAESLEVLLNASDSTSAQPELIRALVKKTLLSIRRFAENKSIHSKLASMLFKHTNRIEGNKITKNTLRQTMMAFTQNITTQKWPMMMKT